MSNPSTDPLSAGAPTSRFSPFGGRARRFLLVAALSVAALGIAACNGDGEGDGLDDPLNGDGTTTTTQTATETATQTETATATETADGGGGSAGALDVEMIDINYSQNEITATAGEELAIDFENTGVLEHTFTIDEIEAEGVSDEYQGDEAAIDVVLQAGETASLSFTPTEAGEYEFYCTVPGHREAGMVGTLTVE